jgi:cytochrome c553
MPSRRAAVSVFALLIAGFGATAHADGDAARGSVLATACLGCHGIEGQRNAYPSYRVPKLGGQKPDYLAAALQGYRAGTRPHPTMKANASALTDADVADIAAFFASYGEPRAAATVTSGPAAAGAEKAALCAACHGEAGISIAPNWPNLAGQHRDYLETAITRYRDQKRQDPVMQSQAAGLTDEDIRNLSAYFSAQSGLFTTLGPR